MSWLKENWLDALIFLLLTAVVVAIVLFLTGVNPFAAKPRVVKAPPPAEQPAAPEAPATPPEAGGEKEEGGGSITVLPLPPAGTEAPAPAPTETPAQPAPSPAPVTEAPSSRPAPKTPASGGRFRVAVGSFTRPSYAAELAKKLESEGYPVRIEVVGRVSRVVVGPYRDRGQAEEVARALERYEPMIYRGDTPLPKGRYLQVAAFKTLDRAAELARELKAKGLDVAIYYRDGWAKVWVGPLASDQVERVRAELKDLGYDVVEVKGG